MHRLLTVWENPIQAFRFHCFEWQKCRLQNHQAQSLVIIGTCHIILFREISNSPVPTCQESSDFQPLLILIHFCPSIVFYLLIRCLGDLIFSIESSYISAPPRPSGVFLYGGLCNFFIFIIFSHVHCLKTLISLHLPSIVVSFVLI